MRAVAWRTPRSVCVLSARCPCCLCVPFLLPGRCTRSHRTSLCQHAIPGERPRCTARQTFRIHTLPTPMCAVRGSRTTCSPLDCRELRQRQQGVNPCLANLLDMAWKRCSPISANARGGPHHHCGLYSTEARDSETHPQRHGSPVQIPPR